MPRNDLPPSGGALAGLVPAGQLFEHQAFDAVRGAGPEQGGRVVEVAMVGMPSCPVA
jgi:hypothetical protein